MAWVIAAIVIVVLLGLAYYFGRGPRAIRRYTEPDRLGAPEFEVETSDDETPEQ
jgi:hypothetical protein